MHKVNSVAQNKKAAVSGCLVWSGVRESDSFRRGGNPGHNQYTNSAKMVRLHGFEPRSLANRARALAVRRQARNKTMLPRPAREQPVTSENYDHCRELHFILRTWCRVRALIPPPPGCRPGALPNELTLHGAADRTRTCLLHLRFLVSETSPIRQQNLGRPARDRTGNRDLGNRRDLQFHHGSKTWKPYPESNGSLSLRRRGSIRLSYRAMVGRRGNDPLSSA